jgi:hypothetical protein
MSDWVTAERLEVLTEHKPAYDDSSSEFSKMAVLKLIAKRLREQGRKGLPKKLSKVGKAHFYLHKSHNLCRRYVSGTWLRMGRMMGMIVME